MATIIAVIAGTPTTLDTRSATAPILRTEIGFDETFIIADIGSGTGLLSQLYLENGNRVLAVEPNDEMRIFAEESLSKFPKISQSTKHC